MKNENANLRRSGGGEERPRGRGAEEKRSGGEGGNCKMKIEEPLAKPIQPDGF
jgi:hypothetical protein